MDGRKIKKLIDLFNDIHDTSDHAEHMACKEGITKADKEYWEEQADLAEQYLYGYAGEIKKLNPSGYMLNKYPELEYILEFA